MSGIGIDNIKTDERIASILNKLKSVSSKLPNEENKDLYEDETHLSNDEITVDNSVKSVSQLSQKDYTAYDTNDKKNAGLLMLPWFSENDRDKEYIHYIKLDDNGDISYDSIKNDSSPNELAALKLKKSFLCDIDYFKSRHYVLYVDSSDSDYNYSRSVMSECLSSDIEVEDVKFVDDSNVITESCERSCDSDIMKEMRYSHYTIFTDMGVAEFSCMSDLVSYPYNNPNLSKWFEETSNYIPLKETSYCSSESLPLSSKSKEIGDFKYDLVTMHRPGIIALDSSDDDSNNKIFIKLKENYEFLPLNRILGCIKYYSTSSLKSFDDFRHFIDKYFDIM